MRYINIDLSSDNHLQQLQIFGGYAGEHNETVLQVTLPQRMIGIEYSDYRFDFQTSEDNEIPVPVSKLINGVLSCHLTEQLTVAGKLLFNVVARKLDGKVVSLTSKTNMVNLYIGDSPDGNSVLPDPNGYKDEILEMVDLRIAAQVDQTYNPISDNAQSGIAINEALYVKKEIPPQDIYTIIFNENYERANGVYKITSTECFSDAYFLYGDFGYVVMDTMCAKYRLHDGEYFYVEFVEQSSEVSKLIVYISKYTSHKIRTFSSDAHLTLEDNVEYIADEPIEYLSIYWYPENFISSVTFTVHPDYGIDLTLPTDTKYIGGVPEFKNNETWELNIKDGIVVAGKIEEAE